MAKEELKNQFVETLKRDNDSIKADRAERIGQSVREAQIQLILNKKSAIRKLEDALAAMTDLSASNNATDVNAVRDIDANAFVAQYQASKEKIEIETRKYDIAVKTGVELFGIDIDSLIK